MPNARPPRVADPPRPPAAGVVITDRLARSIGLRRDRAVPVGQAGLAGAAAPPARPRLPGAWSVVAAPAVMATPVDLGVPLIWAFMRDGGGRDPGATLGRGNDRPGR